MEKFMLTPREACKCTGIGEKQIRDWAKNDTTFPALSVGVDVHIPYDELKAWLSNRARLRVGLKTHDSQVAGVLRKRRKQA